MDARRRKRSEVHIDILSNGDPRFIPRSRAQQEIAGGIALIRSAAEVHPRLRRLLDEQEVSWQYVYDYGKGSVRIADVSADGEIAWSEHLRGVEYGDQPPDD